MCESLVITSLIIACFPSKELTKTRAYSEHCLISAYGSTFQPLDRNQHVSKKKKDDDGCLKTADKTLRLNLLL